MVLIADQKVIVAEKKTEKYKTIAIIILLAVVFILYFAVKLNDVDRGRFWFLIFLLTIGIMIYIILDLFKKSPDIYAISEMIRKKEYTHLGIEYNFKEMHAIPLGEKTLFFYGSKSPIISWDNMQQRINGRDPRTLKVIIDEQDRSEVMKYYALERRNFDIVRREAEKQGLSIEDPVDKMKENQQEE